MPVKSTDGYPPDFLEAAQRHSSFLRLSVWYALLYVLIEGYKELNPQDADVDELLVDERMVSLIRRFRNATFHYQEDPLSDKLLDFLVDEESTVWPRKVNAALKRFFERSLPIEETVRRLKNDA